MLSWRLVARKSDGVQFDITPDNIKNFDGMSVEIKENNGYSKVVCSNIPKCVELIKIIYPALKFELNDKMKVLLSESQGLTISNMQSHEKFTFKPEDPDYIFESRFRSMKFAAILNEEKSMFIALKDDKCFSKSADLYRSQDRKTLFLDVISPLPLAGKNSAIQTFEVAVSNFEGDWFEAAQIYKKLCKPVKKLRNYDRMRNIGIWLWNRDNSSWVIPPAIKLQEDSGVPVALDWYWYHKNPYDTGYPDFYPPREGVAEFSNALAKLRDSAVFTQVYTNGFLWDTMNEDWDEGGSEGVIIDEKGEQVSTVFNVFMKHPMAYMCGCADKFKKKLIKEISLLAACGLEGIYIDMIGCATMQFCYNPTHNHAPGGGSYMADGYRQMLKELHTKLPDLYISTEDCNETYMDVVDSVISIMSPSGERYNFVPPFEFVPVFSAVHHGELTMYGSSAHIDGVPPFDTKWPQAGKWKKEEDWNAVAPYQFFVELGRAVIWGQQPMVANLRPEHIDNQKLSTQYKFICDTAKFYHQNREWLYDGTMEHPGEMECSETEVKFIVRYIFTEEGQFRTVMRTMPCVLHSVWRNSKGDLVLVVLNYTEKEQEFKFKNEICEICRTVPAYSYELIKLS